MLPSGMHEYASTEFYSGAVSTCITMRKRLTEEVNHVGTEEQIHSVGIRYSI